MILIAPRTTKSAWSAINKTHVQRARPSEAMTPAGEAKIAAAQPNGMWDFLNDVDALIGPPDLTKALRASSTDVFWSCLPRSVRQGTLEWIKTAKTMTPARSGSGMSQTAPRPAPNPVPALEGPQPYPPRSIRH